MSGLRPFVSGLVLGGVAMLIACWQSAVVTLQRIGMWGVILAAAAGSIWALAALADVYRELIQFVWDKRKRERENGK